MLTELRISNFGVIEQLAIEFHQGFTVLTGETGAGKSLLIDALALLIGGRASSDHIRSGTEEAHLEAVFSLGQDHPLLKDLRQNNLIEPAATELLFTGRSPDLDATVIISTQVLFLSTSWKCLAVR